MKETDLKKWEKSFEAFHARFGGIFARSESRDQARKYLRGLLSEAERKNGWQVAEVVGDANPDKTQRLLYQAQWQADQARDELRRYVSEALGDAEGIGIVDETGFIKKGVKSAGVKRQYTGTAGKIDNSQVGTFLAYASGRGHTLIDRRLFLPEEWTKDIPRRTAAKVPKGVTFQTKPQQAREMLEQAWENGVPIKWVTGNELYGNASALRDAVASSGRLYVFAVSCNAQVWTKRPCVIAGHMTKGGRQTQPKLAESALQHRDVADVVAHWSAARWQRLAVHQGSKGPIEYDWSTARVVECVDSLPGRDAWLLARRSISEPSDVAYYLSNAAADTPLQMMAHVASSRFKIEQCFEKAKGETGLDHYEVRYYHSWYRHVTLSMMAHAWLAVLRCQAGDNLSGERKNAPSGTRALDGAGGAPITCDCVTPSAPIT
jgi:SRSO17 transposase